MKTGIIDRAGGGRPGWAGLLLMTTALTAVGAMPLRAQEAPSATQTAPLAGQRDFNIPSQSLTTALALFGQQSGLQITADGEMLRSLSTLGVQGRMTPDQALGQLLAGTGLTYFVEGGTLTLRRVSSDGAMILDPVTVEGSATAQASPYEAVRTEGTKSYTTKATTVGKAATAIKDIPQSVSVVTRQMMDDRGVTSLDEAMKQTTGITVVKYDGAGLRNDLQSRGYDIDTVQLDGVAATRDVNYDLSGLDAALFDRIEVLRGPSGLYQSGGEPGGTINLARKRALDHWSFGGEAGIGSWDSYRGVADITGPLVDSKKIRARVVGVVDDRESFVDVVENNKKTFYGSIEADLTDATTLSAGATVQKGDSIYFFGLPAYADGRLLDVDRSTYVGDDWKTHSTFNEQFIELQHRLGNGGLAQLSGRHLDQDIDYASVQANGAVDPVTGDFAARAYFAEQNREGWSLDGHVDTPIQAGGLTHNLLLGVDYRSETARTGSWGIATLSGMNIYSLNNSISYPTSWYYLDPYEQTTDQSGVYGQVRIKPGVEWLTLVGGGRMSWWRLRSENPNTGAMTSKYSAHGEFTPYAGVVWDASKAVSLYASYTEIFKPQSNQDTSGKIIDPRIGGAYEVGVKGSFLNGQLNSHLAAYRMEDQNRAVSIIGCTGTNCYEAAGKVLSQGIETEISGSPIPNWDVSAGYSYVMTEYRTGSDEGRTFSPETPKNTVSLWAKYTFPEGSPLYGFNFGGGVKAVSSFYGELSGVRWIQDGYAVFDAMAGYAFNDNLSASLSVTNLLNEKYYEKVSYYGRQNFYGAPRSAMLTVRAKF